MFFASGRPFVQGMKDFELKLPAAQEGQLYKILDFRHRNAYEILLFMRFWQETDPGLTQNQSLTIQNEQILDKQSLPPLIEGLDNGIIWFNLKYKDSAKERNFLFHNIEKIFQKINNQISVAILYSDAREDKELAKSIKEIKEYCHGPYHELNFNGKEAEVIIYITSDNGPSAHTNLFLQTVSRARRLLILVTHDIGLYGKWEDDSEHVKAMNIAVGKKLVKKYQTE